MAVQYPSGWIANPNNPKEVSAIVGQIKAKNGLVRDLVAVTNWSTGATIYYESPRLPFFLDNPQLREKLLFEQSLFQTNASKTGSIIINSGAYNQYDPKIFSPYIRAVSQRTLEFNRKYGTQQEKDNLANSPFYRSLANTAQSSPTPDQQGGNQPEIEQTSTSAPPTAPDLPPPGSSTSGIDLKPVNVVFSPQKPGRLQYPLDMLPSQDKIKFLACEIQPRNLFEGSDLQFKFPNIKYDPVSPSLPVFLSIQAPISDQNSVEWGPDNVTALDSAIFNTSYKELGSGDNPGDQTARSLNAAYETIPGYGETIKRGIAGQSAGLNNILARTENAILNPNLELLFNSPQLRPFTFQFKLSARDEKEAKEIKNIIKYFKYYMSVRRTTDDLFLKSPCVFTIQYMKGEISQHPGINLISPDDKTKACALTNCSIDYTPLGSYMTYEDGTMVAYTLSLQFQEIEPIYNTDYETYQHPIGF